MMWREGGSNTQQYQHSETARALIGEEGERGREGGIICLLSVCIQIE